MANPTRIESNQTWQNRAELSIAHGALTNSKRPSCFVKGVYPTHLSRGKGCFVWDPQGNRYIDLICGLGTNLLGYGHPEIAQAIYERYQLGCTLSLGTDLEVRTAEKVKELFPFVDRLRFLKTGSDACTSALKIARAKTGSTIVFSEGYHGHDPEFVSLTPPAIGVTSHSSIYKLNLKHLGEHVAAVIIEPVITDFSENRIQWLRDLRAQCTETGTLLIFDEVITGFRFPKWSVSRHLGIEPDLICLGKAIANGMPLSVVGGKKEIMECGEYFVSSTYAGETLSLAAALKTMELLQTKHDIDYLWAKGAYFQKEFNSLWPEQIQMEGYPTRGVFKCHPRVKDLFFQECCKAGILVGSSWFFNFFHISVTDEMLQIFKDVLTRIKTGSVQLQGEPSQSPFAERVRK